jgi:hypothetical protein
VLRGRVARCVRTGFAGATMKDRYTFRAVATRTSDGLVTDADAGVIGQASAGTPTFGPLGAGVWSTPTVDEGRGLLYVTTGDNYSHPATATSDAVVALELATGRIVWSQWLA